MLDSPALLFAAPGVVAAVVWSRGVRCGNWRRAIRFSGAIHG